MKNLFEVEKLRKKLKKFLTKLAGRGKINKLSSESEQMRSAFGTREAPWSNFMKKFDTRCNRVPDAKQNCTLQIKQRNAYFKKYVTNLKILVELYSKESKQTSELCF